MAVLLKDFLIDETGAAAIEYGLIVGIVGLGIVEGLSMLKALFPVPAPTE